MEKELYCATGSGALQSALAFLGIFPAVIGAFVLFLSQKAGTIVMDSGSYTLSNGSVVTGALRIQKPEWSSTAQFFGVVLLLVGIVWFIVCMVKANNKRKEYVSATDSGLDVNMNGFHDFIAYKDIETVIRSGADSMRIILRKGTSRDISGLKGIDNLLMVINKIIFKR